jgi:hypothetical protein
MACHWSLSLTCNLKLSNSSLYHFLRRKRLGLLLHLGTITRELESMATLVGSNTFFSQPTHAPVPRDSLLFSETTRKSFGVIQRAKTSVFGMEGLGLMDCKLEERFLLAAKRQKGKARGRRGIFVFNFLLFCFYLFLKSKMKK